MGPYNPLSLPLFILFFSRGLLKAARRLSSSSSSPRFYWLASDGWGKQSQVVDGIEDFAVGAITVELESKKIQGNTTALKIKARVAVFFLLQERQLLDLMTCRKVGQLRPSSG